MSACFDSGGCYACDGAAIGFRDRRPEGGRLEHACERHADPNVYAAPGPTGELVRVNAPEGVEHG